MQQITISGTLVSDVESCTDKNSRPYMRFEVKCADPDITGRVQFTLYHCTCYLSNLENIKRGDQVFLTGKLTAKLTLGRDGKPYMNLNIMVYQATDGYKIEERKNIKK
jgi:hypothetical protein